MPATRTRNSRTSPSGDYRPRPQRFRRPRLLIIGCGDIGRRVAVQTGQRMRIMGLARSDDSLTAIRAAGITALPAPTFDARSRRNTATTTDAGTRAGAAGTSTAGVPSPESRSGTSARPGDTSRPGDTPTPIPAKQPLAGSGNRLHTGAERARRLARWATHILHSAPPAGGNDEHADPLTHGWLNSLLAAPARAAVAPAVALRRLPGRHRDHRAGTFVGLGGPGSQTPARRIRQRPPARRLVYLSTTGVYGNRNGQWVSETDMPTPQTPRAARRVAAETLIRDTQRSHAPRVRGLVLRVPGIYADDRLPLDRLRQQIPALIPEDDVITNHIHAGDLARIAFTALMRGPAQRTINAIDDSQLRLGEYLDLVASHLGLPPTPRFSRAALAQRLSPMRMSFMSESRRIRNIRLKRELRVRLHYPTVEDFFTRRQA